MERFRSLPILPIVRRDRTEDAITACHILVETGFSYLEIAMTTPGTLDILQELRATYPDVLLGAGTILNVEMADQAYRAGAQFLVAPDFSREVSIWARRQDVAYIPGVMTPAEISGALRSHRTLLKLFPAGELGVSYLKAMKKVFPGVQFMPTGGIAPQDVSSWLEAGAEVVGVGGALTEGTADDIRGQATTALGGL